MPGTAYARKLKASREEGQRARPWVSEGSHRTCIPWNVCNVNRAGSSDSRADITMKDTMMDRCAEKLKYQQQKTIPILPLQP